MVPSVVYDIRTDTLVIGLKDVLNYSREITKQLVGVYEIIHDQNKPFLTDHLVGIHIRDVSKILGKAQSPHKVDTNQIKSGSPNSDSQETDLFVNGVRQMMRELDLERLSNKSSDDLDNYWE